MPRIHCSVEFSILAVSDMPGDAAQGRADTSISARMAIALLLLPRQRPRHYCFGKPADSGYSVANRTHLMTGRSQLMLLVADPSMSVSGVPAAACGVASVPAVDTGSYHKERAQCGNMHNETMSGPMCEAGPQSVSSALLAFLSFGAADPTGSSPTCQLVIRLRFRSFGPNSMRVGSVAAWNKTVLFAAERDCYYRICQRGLLVRFREKMRTVSSVYLPI